MNRDVSADVVWRSTADAFNDFLREVRLVVQPWPEARFNLGQVVRSKKGFWRGVIYDVDAEYAEDEALWTKICENQGYLREQPFYRAFCDSAEGVHFVGYLPEEIMQPDEGIEPLTNPSVADVFGRFLGGRYEYVPAFDA